MREYFRITPILRQLVLHAPNGLPAKAVASLLQRDYTTLLAELGERSGHKTGVELLLPIMDVTGSHLPMDVMADELGMVCVSLPAPHGEEDHPVHQQCMVVVQEFGKLMGTTAEALEDGTITAEERDAIAAKGYEALAAIVKLLKVVEAGVTK